MRLRIVIVLGLASAIVALADSRLSYVFKRGERSRITASGSLENFERISKKYSGDFIWVQKNGREWVIRDEAVLAEANAAFREVDEFEPTLREAERKLQPFETQMEELEKRMDAISDRFDDESLSDAARTDLEAKLREVEEQVQALESRMRGLEEALDRAEEVMDEREEKAERKLLKIIESAIRRD